MARFVSMASISCIIAFLWCPSSRSSRFLYESVVRGPVRGHHVYKDFWVPIEGEVLQCSRETSNWHDPFAVAILKDGTVVGHVPRKISAMCALF